jgi:hypothetical protein
MSRRGGSRIPVMENLWLRRAGGQVAVAILGIAVVGLWAMQASAQSEGDLGACTLRNHVYTCDGAAAHRALDSATTVSLETHNADGIARATLKDLVTKKLGKTLVADGAPADLVFLLEPIDNDAGQVQSMSGLQDLGTLRIYSTTPDGRPAHLLWAEVYSSDPSAHDLPWPMVARGVVAQFEKRFQIK